MNFWQQYVIVPGVMTFLAACAAKKASLSADIVTVIKQIRDICIQIVGQ